MKNLCIFCGSSGGSHPGYIALAKEIGKLLVKHNIGLVYGGASVGVMGAIADSVMLHGGRVIGVIPQSLVDYEVAHHGLTELHIVADMHERKKMMYEKATAFLSLPGGMGTLEEMFEVLTWTQLSYLNKKNYIYNYEGFYNALLSYLKHSHQEGFIKKEHLGLLNEIKDIESLENVLIGLV